MQRMISPLSDGTGLVEEDEDDNDDFDMDLGREQPESDPLWHPYESKTVRLTCDTCTGASR